MMGKPTGFLEYKLAPVPKRPIRERVDDFKEVELQSEFADFISQGARCMDCGIPFCHSFGCPLANLIPDFNDLVFRGRWQQALKVLESTNNFPEITGRICPAPCEAACTLEPDFEPVCIRRIELAIAEMGWKEGWIKPKPNSTPTGYKVGIVGSGPAGLAAAQELARKGHQVVVFEKSPLPGGILRYGIPNFKLDKEVIDRRLNQLKAEGISFQTGVEAGTDLSGHYLKKTFDAILIATGAGVARDLEIPGRELGGIYLAMDYLVPQNLALETGSNPAVPNAKDRKVIVIGGGDTGSDCVGTAQRQGAKNICQIEIMPQPPERRTPDNPWPNWPRILRTSTSQEEGCQRIWATGTTSFIGADRQVNKLRCVDLDWTNGYPKEIPGSERELETDLVLLALGFLHPEQGKLIEDLELDIDQQGNIAVDPEGKTNQSGIYAAGDAASGASLVVRAINQGRVAASGIHQYLSG